jgi:hypothetical protein
MAPADARPVSREPQQPDAGEQASPDVQRAVSVAAPPDEAVKAAAVSM